MSSPHDEYEDDAAIEAEAAADAFGLANLVSKVTSEAPSKGTATSGEARKIAAIPERGKTVTANPDVLTEVSSLAVA